MIMQLLNDQYAPITSEIGFLECSVKTATAAYVDWQRPIQSERRVSVACHETHGDFVSKISSLLPLTSIERRRALFLPTKGKWTAYFDNGWQGTDAYSVISYLCQRIGCRGLRAVSVLDTFGKIQTGARGRYGATVFELYAPNTQDCFFLNTRRSVFAANDGGRWKFEANGEPLAFEESEQYEARRVQDRFTSEMLDRYLSRLGIQFFSTAFYDVPPPAQLISKEGPCAPDMRSYSLDEARSNF